MIDQSKVGKFIAEARRSKNLTQKQLADVLSISDKTISKWECGKGLPEVSLMLPLCEALDVSVNELLSGEQIASNDYQEKAEENMMKLMKENENAKKRIISAVIISVLMIMSATALVMLSAYVDLPFDVRIMLVALACVLVISGIATAIMLDIQSGYFECPNCKAEFVPSTNNYMKGVHTFTKRKLTCPNCGKTSMCKHRITR